MAGCRGGAPSSLTPLRKAVGYGQRPLPCGRGRFAIYLPSVATAAAAVTVAVPVQNQEDQDDDPNVTIVENVAKAAHIDFRPFTYLEGRERRTALPFC